MCGTEASHINEVWAGLLIEELVRQGAGPFFLSPGSRCTPLTLAVARHPQAVAHVHFDERAMAFHALGHAKAAGTPAVLICTSGTAAANYLPAVVEAAQAQVPMLLLTADRPPELLACGANQAIEQPGLYGGYVRWAAELPCPDENVPPQVLLTTVDHAVHQAQGAVPGPVHVNCMFREPLAPADGHRDFTRYLGPVMAWKSSDRPYTKYTDTTVLHDSDLAELAKRLQEATNGMLVVGALRTGEEARAVALLADRLGWPAVPDVLSGLRLGCPGTPWLPHFDQVLLAPESTRAFRPDVVLHVGGAIVSKRLQVYLETHRPEYLRLSPHPLRHDSGHLVRHRMVCPVGDTCARLGELVHVKHGSDPRLAQADSAIAAAVDAWLAEQEGLNEVGVARTVSRARPPGCGLFMGNSMPIRDMDMYGTADGTPGPVYANRGASGIDGNIATAAGIGLALEAPLIAVLGDLATLHDLNALALLPRLPKPLVLVVINNDGGGIFSFLPVAAQSQVFEPCFATPHGRRFNALAEAFGIDYCLPESSHAFEQVLLDALGRTGPTLIEVRTDRAENLAHHQALQGRLAKLVADRMGG